MSLSVSQPTRARARLLWNLIETDRLRDLTLGFLRIASPTGDEAAFANHLAECLRGIPMAVEMTHRYPQSPNVIARLRFARPGKTLQLDGHLDTIDMPHAPPRFKKGRIFGRGACDMKGALACMAEAARILIAAAPELAGSLLVTAHSLHEMPVGHNEALDDMIERGYYGDAVIIGECGSTSLPIAGLGMAVFDITVERQGDVLHETKAKGVPNPILYANRIATALAEHAQSLAREGGPLPESLFIGQIHGGDFYNRIPTVCRIQGTRRYAAPKGVTDIRQEFDHLLAFTKDFAAAGIRTQTTVTRAGDGFRLSPEESIVRCLKEAYQEVHGTELRESYSTVVGNAPWFIRDAHVPCLYHGPDQSSAHGDIEYVDLDDMVRVCQVYILTALLYLQGV
ncbi:MAG: M20/M25/M40 family metallo-hydrolase [Anaerolineae bacterium]|nr:M20/M25/M40 family metallo-hydrolase [Anaerolineae bacterium]